MTGLKLHNPYLQSGRGLIGADEVDMYQQYQILHPSVDPGYFGTMSLAGTSASGTLTTNYTRADFPRNLLISYQSAGTVGGTATVSGKNQFGVTISEAIGMATAASTLTTKAGTKVFAEVSSVSWAPAGTTSDYAGSVKLGVAIATASDSPIFGLPSKIGATTDIKAVTWLDSDVAKSTNASTHADVSNHAIRIEVAGGLALADSFSVLFRSSYNASGEGTVSGL